DDFQRHATRLGGALEVRDRCLLGIEGDQRELRPELLEHVAPARQELRRQRMAGTRLEGVRAVRAAHSARRAEYDRRAFVVRLVGDDARRRVIGMLVPGALELGAVTHWTIS